jgi:ATP-dependent protease ClpP protease subunit
MKETTTKSAYDDSYEKEFNVAYFPHKSGTYRIEIDDTIFSVSQFSTAIQALQVAKEDDDVEIHLQCNGGNVDACGAFLHAMRKCAAPIHVVATGGCHSAATHILLNANSFELSSNFNSLIHCGSTGAIGTLSEYNSKTAFDRNFLADMYRQIYEGFMTSEEIEDMLKGQDLWLDADAWMERYNKRNQYFLAKEAAAKAPAKKTRKKTKKEPCIPPEL